jgi:hypothetical protein
LFFLDFTLVNAPISVIIAACFPHKKS